MRLRRTDYEIVLADPPWAYNARNNPDTRFGGGAGGHYPTMSVDEMSRIPVSDYCAPNSLLFMWVTFPRLREGLWLMEQWGWEYVTVGFVWVKARSMPEPCPSLQAVFPPSPATPFFGVGFYTKSNVELCLLGRRGRALKPATDSVSQLIIAPLTRHSEKPLDAQFRIEAMYPDAVKCELFARREREGWDCYGIDIDPSMDLSGLEKVDDGI
jgi:N6-adenosine-specific RNA methylase IME4